MADEKASKAYDLVDGMGVKWEVKANRLCHVTGNVYVEIQTLEASQTDKSLIFAGPAFVMAKSALIEAITALLSRDRDRNTAGGDLMKSLGVCVPLESLEGAAEAVLIL